MGAEFVLFSGLPVLSFPLRAVHAAEQIQDRPCSTFLRESGPVREPYLSLLRRRRASPGSIARAECTPSEGFAGSEPADVQTQPRHPWDRRPRAKPGRVYRSASV